MNYRSLADLARTVRVNLHKIPRDIDLVVGVPRSGLLVANFIALALNVCLTDIDGLLENRRLNGGQRKRRRNISFPHDALHILVVDDSVMSGYAIERAKKLVADAGLPHRITYLAAYAAPQSTRMVDIFLEEVPIPRFFEWNVMNHPHLESCCMEIDGVLCSDLEDHGPEDAVAVKRAQPLFMTEYEIGHLVTGRPESLRRETEEWLKQHKVRYRHLHMLGEASSGTHQPAGSQTRFKATTYRDCTDAELFIEGCPDQAAEISNISGKPVLCLRTGELYRPGMSIARVQAQYHTLARRLYWRTRHALFGNAA